MSFWLYNTRLGPFVIVALSNGRYDLRFGDASLGNYVTPEQAADDAGGGHHYSVSAREDGRSLGVPRDLSDWEYVRR